jgi:hypothetical protein
MEDRIPTKPNRYAVYDENHNFLRYEYHERADEPTQVGDALNKANLLPDDVAAALGLTGNPQVKDALEKIKTIVDGNTTLANSKAKIAVGSYTGTGAYGAANPISITLPAGCIFFSLFQTTFNNGDLDVAPGVNSGFSVHIPSLSASYKKIYPKGDTNFFYAKFANGKISYYHDSSTWFNGANWTYTYYTIS